MNDFKKEAIELRNILSAIIVKAKNNNKR